MFKEIIRPSLILFLVCVVIAGALAYVNGVTEPIISENNKKAEQESLARVIPGADGFSDSKTAQQLKNEGIQVTDSISRLYEAKKGQETFGYVVEVITKGYGGAIKMFIGVDTNKNITGVTLTSHNETPGLGSKAADEGFVGQYLGGIPDKLFTVVKGSAKADNEIQAVTGATISSRAVTAGVNEAITLIDSLAGGV